MVFIATVVVSLAWVYRTSKNLVALGADGQRFSPQWAVICWFIPIISLFRPYQVVREVWNASAPDLQPGDRSWQEAGGTPFIKWWWALWLFSGWIGNLGLRRLFSSETAEELLAADTVSIVVDAMYLITAVLFFLLVERLTNRQDERHRLMTDPLG